MVVGALTYKGAERGNPVGGVSKSLQPKEFTLQGITPFGFQFLPIRLRWGLVKRGYKMK